jgi:hypothetical protein
MPSVTVEGDGRLVDAPDVSRGQGWDTCPAARPLTDSTASDVMPAARRGQRYLIAGAGPASPSVGATGDDDVPQAYWWLTEPGSAQGLWIDLVALGGPVAPARLSVYETDSLCKVQRRLWTGALDALLDVPGQWRTTCVDFSTVGTFKSFGIKIDSGPGKIGVDAVRFGPRCPTP